jgi:replication factor A1
MACASSYQVPVDVAGVVVSLGTFGTVKRKADNSELARRDVTLADQRWVANL